VLKSFATVGSGFRVRDEGLGINGLRLRERITAEGFMVRVRGI
jgi:hypothetical protein